MVDTLDTLYILGNFTEFDRAVEEVIRKINFAIDRNVSVFETNIRVVGGLLSAHIFAEERMATGRSDAHHAVYRGELLHMARELADRLLPAFDTPTGIPFAPHPPMHPPHTRTHNHNLSLFLYIHILHLVHAPRGLT
jgi:mannosidase alpha-like ER degradation enhancer 3